MPLLSQDVKLQEQGDDNVTIYNKLLSMGRGLPLESDDFVPIHELIAKLAREKPNDIAIISGTHQITYGLLQAWGRKIAVKLATEGIGAGKRVAVFVEPSIEMVASVLGILQCGGAYVPLDRNQPNQRIKNILHDAGASAVITNIKDKNQLNKFGLPIYEIGPAPINDHPNPQYDRILSFPVNKEDPAYIIYTSGSTGESKGVLVKHKHLSASTLARRMVYPNIPVFLLVSPLAFDSSVAGIWGTLTGGGCLVVASYDEVHDPLRLLGIIDKQQVTHLLCIPSLYETLLDAAEKDKPNSMGSVNTIIVAGEPLRKSLLQRHFAFHHKFIDLVNEYGPTEATVWATYRIFKNPSEPVSIGGPIPGTFLYVLDDDLKPVRPGEVGELFIGGSQVADGYFGKPKETKQVFLTDSFIDEPGARMYRSGDLVTWNLEGTLDFIGRRDHQVKIRGHRIELSAIETVIMKITDNREVVVVPNSKLTLLTAFIVGPSTFQLENVYELLKQALPPIMIPTRIRMIDCFPLTISGKVDRAALSAAAEEVNNTQMMVEASKKNNLNDNTQMTKYVSAAWKELLNLPAVPTNVNFFDLGGHSLMVFKLQDALERHTGKRPSIVSLFRHTTVTAQAQLISSGGAHDTNSTSRHTLTGQRRARSLRMGDQSKGQ